MTVFVVERKNSIIQCLIFTEVNEDFTIIIERILCHIRTSQDDSLTIYEKYLRMKIGLLYCLHFQIFVEYISSCMGLFISIISLTKSYDNSFTRLFFEIFQYFWISNSLIIDNNFFLCILNIG